MTMTAGALLTAEDVEPYPDRRTIERGPQGGPRTMLLIAPPGTPAAGRWALVQHHVSGWTCLATGTHTPTFPATSQAATDRLAEIITGHYGDGIDRLSPDDYGLIGATASVIHIRRVTPARIGAYCGESLTRPYVPGAAPPRRYMQHCTTCTTTYRAENYGRCPVEA